MHSLLLIVSEGVSRSADS